MNIIISVEIMIALNTAIIIIIITEVTANRPDVIIKNKKEKTRTLISVAIPADRMYRDTTNVVELE